MKKNYYKKNNYNIWINFLESLDETFIKNK